MADPILPIVDDAIARGVIKLKALRPSAAPFLISGGGRYFDPFAGWRAQLMLLRNRVADEVASRRLTLAQGKALVELASSEFFADLNPDPQTAVGIVEVFRPATGASGTIKAGTRFKLHTDQTLSPPVAAASYISREPVFVGASVTAVNVPLIAELPGPDANIPRFANADAATIDLADDLFDPTLQCVGIITPSSTQMAGGSSGLKTDVLVALARAMYLGAFAPTDGALFAGALTDAAVAHVALVKDTTLAQTLMFVADESWAWSQAFNDQCAQILKDTWLGWGARVAVRQVANYQVGVAATAVLADPKFGDDTTELSSIIRQKVSDYFDKRPDFYHFDIDSIGAVIATCDPRILTCTHVVVTDLQTGDPLTAVPLTGSSNFAYHFMLPAKGVDLTTTFPS